MSQDQVVADFYSLITTETATLTSTLLSYHATLSANLFAIAELDDEHKQEIRDISRTNLIRLRQRLETLVVTVRSATAAPDI